MNTREPPMQLLGIDIGTSKAAAVLWDADAGEQLAVASVPHAAGVPGLPPGHVEQDVARLWRAVASCLEQVGREKLASVSAIGITGQMHGVVLLDAAGEPCSHLVTWQDQRCLEDDFLVELATATDAQDLSTGFGCATLAWLAKRNRLPSAATSACTIHDALAAKLCGMSRPATDASGAASFGLYDRRANCWNAPAVSAAGIPPSLLPTVVACATRIGASGEAADAFFLPTGVPVMAAIGDNQASVRATLEGRDPERALVLTLGTGGQLSAVMPAGYTAHDTADRPYEFRPYPGDRVVTVAASLAGGSAMAWLVDSVGNWLDELGAERPSPDTLYGRLNELGVAAPPSLIMRPTLFGERHDPTLRGSLDGIAETGFTLGAVTRALATGIITNLRDMLPPGCFDGRTHMLGTGNALRRLPILQQCAEEVLRLPLSLPPAREEATLGAALLAGEMVRGSIPASDRRGL